MSISQCMICTKNRRPVRKHYLFTSDCIGCSTRSWHEQNSIEKWQEICLTPQNIYQDKNLQSSNTDSPVSTVQTHRQYLQIGYRPSKQPWRTKALHIFESFVRRRSSSAQNTCEQSKASSDPPSGIETAQRQSEVECKALVEVNQNATNALANTSDSSNTHQQSITRVIGPGNHNFDDGQESSLDVLALMHLSTTGPVPASDQTLSLKCCCSDADLTKPSMCGDRACVTCSVHDHRLVTRQVSMAAEAAAQAAASVLAVPQLPAERDEHQGWYNSAPTTPNQSDVQCVLHCVRSALENRLRSHRPELTIHQADVATCTTPSTQDSQSAMNPILLSLGKMYQKNLYLSALLHNLSSLDVKRLASVVNDCRTKIEQLEEVCRQRSDTVVERRTVDVAVGEEQKTVDAAVGDECVKKEDKGQNTVIEKIDSQTETADLGVEAGVQVSDDEGERGGRKPADSIGSEEPWGRITAGLSNADFNSLNLTQSYLLEPFLMQFEDSPKPENSFPETPGSSTDNRPQQTVTSKAQTQKSRQIKPAKHPARPPICPSSLLSNPAERLRTILARRVDRIPPPRQSGPSAGIQKHPAPRQLNATSVSARFAGGRAVVNDCTTRRGLPECKYPGSKFGAALRK